MKLAGPTPLYTGTSIHTVCNGGMKCLRAPTIPTLERMLGLVKLTFDRIYLGAFVSYAPARNGALDP